MSNIQTGAERMPHDLSHLGFLAGQIGRLITISTTPVIAGDSFEMDAVGALRLSPLRRGLAIDSTVDIRSEERFSRNAETDLVCRLLLEKKHALRLWRTGIHEARLLATMIDDPGAVMEEQMEAWAADFDSWEVDDQCCSNLFDRTTVAWS